MDEPEQEAAAAATSPAASSPKPDELAHAVATILYKHVKMEDTRISIEQGHFSELVRELVQYIRTGVFTAL